jgi:hypothetical protein
MSGLAAENRARTRVIAPIYSRADFRGDLVAEIGLCSHSARDLVAEIGLCLHSAIFFSVRCSARINFECPASPPKSCSHASDCADRPARGLQRGLGAEIRLSVHSAIFLERRRRAHRLPGVLAAKRVHRGGVPPNKRWSRCAAGRWSRRAAKRWSRCAGRRWSRRAGRRWSRYAAKPRWRCRAHGATARPAGCDAGSRSPILLPGPSRGESAVTTCFLGFAVFEKKALRLSIWSGFVRRVSESELGVRKCSFSC